MEDNLVRDALHGYVEDNEPPMATTSGGLLDAGRTSRRRRVTMTVIGSGLGAVALVAAVGAVAMPGNPRGTPAPLAAGRQADTATGRAIDAAIRHSLPGGEKLVLTSLYPSDWNHDAKISDPALATDWHGAWTIHTAAGDQALYADLSYLPRPDKTVPCNGCDEQSGPHDTTIGTFQGGYDHHTAAEAQSGAIHYRTATFEVAVSIGLLTNQNPIEVHGYRYSADELVRAATDPALTIPKPRSWPPKPSPSSRPKTLPGVAATYQVIPHPPGESEGAVRTRLTNALTGDLPHSDTWTVVQPPHPMAKADPAKDTAPPAAYQHTPHWYGEWRVPGAGNPHLGLTVSQSGVMPANSADAYALCTAGRHETLRSCALSKHGSTWLTVVNLDRRVGGTVEDVWTATAIQADGSVVTVSAWTTAPTGSNAHPAYSRSQLGAAALDPDLWIPQAG